MKIDNFRITDSGKIFIIAELSANHNGKLENALATIKAAKRAGADAIKLQTFTPDTITIDSKNEDFRLSQNTIWDGKYFYELYKEAYTPWEWHSTLFKAAKDEGLICFSTPFDRTSVDFLETLKTPAYKIASFEITDIPLIEYVASKGKPILISTGIATVEDIELALIACKKNKNDQIALLKCTSSYPAPLEEANLIMIKELAERFNVMVGLSDHTIGIVSPVVAAALGARVIEKHFILSKDIGGPDATFSLTEEEFTIMVKSVRDAEKTLGTVNYNLTQNQKKSRELSRSLYVVKDVKNGEIVTDDNVRSIRPGFGLHPKYSPMVIGKKFNKDVSKGTRFSLDLVIYK